MPEIRSFFGKIAPSNVLLSVVIILGLGLLAATSGGSILSGQGIRSMLIYMCVPVLIALSQMVVLAIGQLNLAVGPLGGMTCAAMSVAMASWGVPPLLALAGGLLLSTAIGALNGLLLVVTRLHGFIITLATMTILEGVQYGLVSSYTIDNYSATLKGFGNIAILNMPLIFLITIVVACAVHFFFSRTVDGRNILATGGASDSAALSGISTERSTILAYTLSGLLVGVAAIISMTTLTGVNRTIGGDWLLPSFAAPIIAGVLLTGGVVQVAGTILASGILRLVDMARAQFLLDPSWTNFTIGTVVLITVLVNELRQRRQTVVVSKRKR